MITIKDVFEDYKQLNNIYDPQEVEALTLLTISEILNSSKASIKAFPEKIINDKQAHKLSETVNRLLTGEPLQYILGTTEFYGLSFKVNPTVLIPRPETEELVEWVLIEGKRLREKGEKLLSGEEKLLAGDGFHILDIGTGSGCIAISIGKNIPGSKVSAIDISEGALQTARENAQLNGVDIDFIQADILNFSSETKIPKLQIIVSNPPYVTPADKMQMHSNVTNFEPHTALFVPQNDPLLFYKAIADFAKVNLWPGGLLFFEINESYGQQTVEMLNQKGFTGITLKQDMSGRDRMIKAVTT